jgi:hypothetical protein
MIDRRVLDSPMTDGVVAFFRRLLLSPSANKRAEEVQAKNPKLINNIKVFEEYVGETRSQANLIGLAYFKHFKPIPRPDNPQITTISVDFTIDETRANLALWMQEEFLGHHLADE